MRFDLIFNFAVCTFLIACAANGTLAANDSCGSADWTHYKDEHCYRLITTLLSFDEAEKLCQTNNSTLAVIHFAEEQTYLSSYIFKTKKTVDDVWIGAKYDTASKLYQWQDHTAIKEYSNWATGNPKNLADHCVLMTGDEGAVGKWVDERCERKKLAICQKAQPVSLALLAATVSALKRELAELSKKVAGSKPDPAKGAAIPIGFTYFQLPKDKAPGELWPGLTWTDVSKEYEGVFFRVVGGGSASFGQFQAGNAPRLETVHTDIGFQYKLKKESHDGDSNNVTIPITGWSDSIVTTNLPSGKMYINFKNNDDSEVRPKNMAVKVFRRTA